MSSIHIDASGQRGITQTLNDPARSTAQIATKDDDDLLITAGGVEEFSLILDSRAKVKVLQKDGRQVIVLKTPSISATGYRGEYKGGYPHATVRALKNIGNDYADAEVVSEANLAELLGITAGSS